MNRSATGTTVTTLTNARIAAPGGTTVEGWLRIADGRIAELGAGTPPPAGSGTTGSWESGKPGDSVTTDMGGRHVLPGAVDIHVHGGAGAAFTEADPERARRIVEFNRKSGVTTVIGGLVTATPEDLIAQVSALADLCDDGDLGGIYLEGPYIAGSKCGAHDPALLRDPDLEEFERLVKAGRGHVRMITLAPELPGAHDVIRAAAAQGVVAAIGHTEATYAQTLAAFDAGATVATHIYNQMRPLHHREPGPIAAALTDDRVTVELINDGVHVHPGAARLVFDAAGDRVALVTDAMSATGLGDGDYTLGNLEVTVSAGQATLTGTDTIASSTIVLPDAIRRAARGSGGGSGSRSGREAGGGAAQGVGGIALADASRAASATPAKALGLSDVGVLAPGYRADLLVLDADLETSAVMHRGEWV